MYRRQLLGFAAVSAAAAAFALPFRPKPAPANAETAEKAFEIVKSDSEWRRILSREQYAVLRQEGTEYAHTSPLLNEKREGTYACAGCDLPLYSSKHKFDSGTGWPSFWAPIEGHVATKTDYKLIFPRTEYHCARCEGHQGHVFNDGPQPTGQRWCNNGVALKFLADTEA